jgi:hypothetical protein
MSTLRRIRNNESFRVVYRKCRISAEERGRHLAIATKIIIRGVGFDRGKSTLRNSVA